MANCNSKTLDASVRSTYVVGVVEWRNPYGYLHGQFAANLPIYWSLATFFFFYLVVWIVLSIKYRKGLMTLQYLIGLVILCCLTEAIVWGTGDLTYNIEGRINKFSKGSEAFLNSVKDTSLLLLFLVVGMGLSITRETLTVAEYFFTTILAIAYFSFQLIFEFQKLTTSTGEPVYIPLEWIGDIGLFLTNIVFLAWITFATYTTMVELKSESQSYKFSQYRTLVILILTCLALSILLAIFQLIVEAVQVQDDWFRWWWIWEVYWQLLRLAAVLTISILWKPSENNALYAYSQQLPQGDEGESSKEDAPVELDADNETNKDDNKVNVEEGNKKANISSDEDSYTSSSL